VLDQARAALLQARQLNPNEVAFLDFLALIEVDAAGTDLSAARRAVADALRVSPGDYATQLAAARLHRLEAERRKGASASAQIEAGLTAAERARSIRPDLEEALTERERLLQLRARMGQVTRAAQAARRSPAP
jgi:hypothetical protein